MSYIDDQKEMYQKLCRVSMELIYLNGQVKKTRAVCWILIQMIENENCLISEH